MRRCTPKHLNPAPIPTNSTYHICSVEVHSLNRAVHTGKHAVVAHNLAHTTATAARKRSLLYPCTPAHQSGALEVSYAGSPTRSPLGKTMTPSCHSPRATCSSYAFRRRWANTKAAPPAMALHSHHVPPHHLVNTRTRAHRCIPLHMTRGEREGWCASGTSQLFEYLNVCMCE